MKPTYIPGHNITLSPESWLAIESLCRITGDEYDNNLADFVADETTVSLRGWTGCTIFGLDSESIMRIFELTEVLKKQISEQIQRAAE